MARSKMNNTIVTYDGIKFKSKLERTCYQLLQEAKISFKYEDETYTLIDKASYPSMESVKRKGKKVFKNNPTIRSVKYTPDFVGEFKDGTKWIIETKGMKTTTFNIKWKLFKTQLIEKGLEVVLFMPTNKEEIVETIKLIQKYGQVKKRPSKAA